MGVQRHVVVVGGGLAAGTLVTELRDHGFTGPVTLLAGEAHAPYERPPLSKDLLLGTADESSPLVHDLGWYAAHDVDLRLGSLVDRIDLSGLRVRAGDEWFGFDRLVLATGADARHLALADESGAPVTYLRTLDDALALRGRLKEGVRVAIIGGGWIGLEVASSARQQGAEVTVLEALDLPLQRVLGDEVATAFADLHREHGVDLRTGAQVSAIRAEGDGVRLELQDGAAIEADLLVVGVGVTPTTALAERAGLSVDNGIRTDARMVTSDPHVLAIGDVANADHATLGRPVRVEHWDVAIQHAKVAAATIRDEDRELTALPYFFTDQYDAGIEYVGNPGPEGYDRVELDGDVHGRVFRAWWWRGDTLVAGMHMNDWDAIDEIRSRVAAQK